MKLPVVLISGIATLAIGFSACNLYIYNEKQGDMDKATKPLVKIIPIEHASAVIAWDGDTLYTDPLGGAEAFAGQPAPDIILLTDIHGDHLSTSTLEAITGDATIIAPQAVADMLPGSLAPRVIVMHNGETIEEQGFRIKALPMYNIPESESAFHTKGRGNGYAIEKDGYRVYIAGDTAGTPEMRALTNIDVALVPMNLPYTMSVEEAADAVLAFKPKIVYPYHYRGPGGLADVEHFKQLVEAADPTIKVVLAKWY